MTLPSRSASNLKLSFFLDREGMYEIYETAPNILVI